MPMKEVEVKARVVDFTPIIQKLEDLGCTISKPVTQEDHIYIHNSLTFDNFPKHGIVLRVRRQGQKAFFTLKQSQSNELDSLEHETIIEKPEEIEHILKLLDYKKTLDVTKKRRKTHFKDMEICLDDVKGLGTFIEVERLTNDDSEKVQDELFAFLKTLGIREEDRFTQGYDSLIIQLGKE